MPLPAPTDFRSKWKANDAVELRELVRNILKDLGWVTCTDKKSLDRANGKVNIPNEPGLLNQIVDRLLDQLQTELERRDEKASVNLIIENLRRYAENVVYLAVCDQDGADTALDKWDIDKNPTEMSERRTQWRTGNWRHWRALLAAVCLNQLRRELSDVAELAADVAAEGKKRWLALAQLWEVLVPSSELWLPTNASPPYWIPPKYLPTDKSCLAVLELKDWNGSEAEPPCAFGLLRALGQSFPRSYGVWFPTVIVSGTQDPNSSTQANSEQVGQLGCVLNATVNLPGRSDVDAGDTKTNSDELRPPESLSIAPWSAVLIIPEYHKILVERVSATRKVLNLTQDSEAVKYVLLDFTPVTGSPVRTPSINGHLIPAAVGGQSLEVSVMLALWAASESLVLYPIVATGMVNEGKFEGVKEVPKKLTIIAELFQSEPIPRVLLEQSNFSEVQNALDMSHDDSGDWVRKGRFKNRLDVYCLPKKLEDLKRLKHLLLTDGFDEYRKFMKDSARERDMALAVSEADSDGPGVYLKEDRDELDEAVQRAVLVAGRGVVFPQERGQDNLVSDGGDQNGITVLPFDNDPRPAMRYVTAKLFARIGGSPSEPVPVPLCLQTLASAPHGRLSSRDRWLDAILQGFSDLQQQPGTRLSADRKILRVILQSRDWSKFCFVAYAPRSLECDLDQLTDAIRRLRQVMSAGRAGDSARKPPSVLWIASDDHQARWLNAMWTEGGASPFAVVH